jgi:hypothetical protein
MAELSSTASFILGSETAFGDQLVGKAGVLRDIPSDKRLRVTDGHVDRLENQGAIDNTGYQPAPVLAADGRTHGGGDDDTAIRGEGNAGLVHRHAPWFVIVSDYVM